MKKIQTGAFTGPIDEIRHTLKTVPTWQQVTDSVIREKREIFGSKYDGRYEVRQNCYRGDKKLALPIWWIDCFCLAFNVSLRRYYETYKRYRND